MTVVRPFATLPHLVLLPTSSPAPPPYRRYRHQSSSPPTTPFTLKRRSRPRSACRCYCCLSGLPVLSRNELATSMKQRDPTSTTLRGGANSRVDLSLSSSASSEERSGESGVKLELGGMDQRKGLKDKNADSGHRCLWNLLHVMCGMKVLVSVGVLSILGILSLEAMYFRRAIFILLIPTMVTSCTLLSIVRRSPHLVWPIIGISFFHMFLSGYLLLIFGFYFFFKPLYIIMVLNWAFDTLHTKKTLSFYLYSLTIASVLTVFLLFNLWQLVVSLRYRDYLHYRRLHEQQGRGSASLSAVEAYSSTSSTSLTDNNSLVVDQRQSAAKSGGEVVDPLSNTARQQLHQQQHQPYTVSLAVGAINGCEKDARRGVRNGFVL